MMKKNRNKCREFIFSLNSFMVVREWGKRTKVKPVVPKIEKKEKRRKV